MLKRWFHIHFEDVFKSPPDKMKCYSFPEWCIAWRVTIITQTSTSHLLTQMNEFLLKMCMYVCPVCSSVRRWIVPAESTCSSFYMNILVLATGAFGLSTGAYVKLLLNVLFCEKRYTIACKEKWMSQCITYSYKKNQDHRWSILYDAHTTLYQTLYWDKGGTQKEQQVTVISTAWIVVTH